MITGDAKASTRGRQAFKQARKAETQYAVQLRKVARHISDLVKGFPPGVQSSAELTATLRQYSQLLLPWARSTTARMIAEVARRDEKAWAEYAGQMGRTLREEIRKAPTGQAMRDLLADQVELITSLPLDAATRVHELTMRAMSTGTRASEIAAEILNISDVTKARATLIARTEVGRTATTLTMVRAQSIGSEQYIWRTAKDADVRPWHRKLEGKVCRWDAPPRCDPPDHRAHPGSIWNCRCYAEPILPDL